MTEKAMFGAGCFWGVEEFFRPLPGVLATSVGYSGGHTENPTYEQVCTKGTGHAEVVWVEFDPGRISYANLLDVFWDKHNPTTLNRQGPDIGDQYRSVIFTFDDTQKQLALASKHALEASDRFHDPVVTQITEAGPYWLAEDYHQKYLLKKAGGYQP